MQPVPLYPVQPFAFNSKNVRWVGTVQSAVSDVWMCPIRLKAVLTAPKDTEIVNKLYPIGEASSSKPCCQVKSAEGFHSLLQGWKGA